MSKIHPGAISTTGGFQFTSDAPLDDRLLVESYEDLAELTKYDGMIVFVKNDTKYYSYINNAWEVLSTAGGEVDETLSISGASADSLVVGNKLKEIYQRIDNLQNTESGLDSTDDGQGNVTMQFLYVPLNVTDDDLGNVSIAL